MHVWICGCLVIGECIDWSFLPVNWQFCHRRNGNLTPFQEILIGFSPLQLS